MVPKKKDLLTDAQLASELARCEYCREKPCKEACPADCSPADFIMAARKGGRSDFRRAANLILSANPLGGVCGAVCPDSFCVQACARRTFDQPIRIPAVQAAIIARSQQAHAADFPADPPVEKSIAVIGAGPAGLAAAALLAQKGYRVSVYERSGTAGGMCRLIPDFRLDKQILRRDIETLRRMGRIAFRFHRNIEDPRSLLSDHAAVVMAVGLDRPIPLSVPGEEKAVSWVDCLSGAQNKYYRGKRMAIVGGGAIAVDCAVTACRHGASAVDLLYRRKQENMPLTASERNFLLEYGIDVLPCVRVKRICVEGRKVTGVDLLPLILPKGKEAIPANFIVDPAAKAFRRSYDGVVVAIGSGSGDTDIVTPGIFYAGDRIHGATSVVEAVASGKNAALAVDAFLRQRGKPRPEKRLKSRAILPGRRMVPVPLETEFFGRTIASPFLLSAAPHTDGYRQMAEAYRQGWPGGVMKTAFDNLPIHIPGGYMFVMNERTYGNCDNVSAHPLDRVCREVERLVREYPDRLTMASTGGPITGRDPEDCRVWQSNTGKLEAAGVMGIEYSLSCPQGGDGMKGDIVSQDPEATAKVIEWVLQRGDRNVPKLFKLTGAVTSIRAILLAVKNVLQKYPDKKAGVTLANSFPTLAFRSGSESNRDQGVVVGMSGEGVLPISNLTLAKAAGLGVIISGNGGPMDYRSAAGFLALGAETVQFCTVVMKYGLSIVDELHSGLSYLLWETGRKSVRELIGSALPRPITPFEQLSAAKPIPEVQRDLCQSCGNCAHCPYMAIRLSRRGYPAFDASKCVGCSLCVQKCFAGALRLRDRTPREQSAYEEQERHGA